MQLSDVNKARIAAATVDAATKLEKIKLRSIRLVANMHLPRGQNQRETPTVSIEILPDDPRFAEFEAMVRGKSADQKAEAQATLDEMGIDFTVNQEELTKVEQASIAAKAAFEEQQQQIAVKKAVAKALAEAKP